VFLGPQWRARGLLTISDIRVGEAEIPQSLQGFFACFGANPVLSQEQSEK
jgi:hypothetical protein